MAESLTGGRPIIWDDGRTSRDDQHPFGAVFTVVVDVDRVVDKAMAAEDTAEAEVQAAVRAS